MRVVTAELVRAAVTAELVPAGGPDGAAVTDVSLADHPP